MSNSYFHSKLQSKSTNVSLEHFQKSNLIILRKNHKSLDIFLEKNCIPFVLGLTYIYRILNSQGVSLLLRNIQALEMKLVEVEDQFQQYNNQQTIKSILRELVKMASNKNKWSEWVTMVNTYPISVFAITTFVRIAAKEYFQSHMNLYEEECLGNQKELLVSYKSQIRNTPLKIIADALNIKLRVLWSGVEEIIGQKDNMIELRFDQQGTKLTIVEDENYSSLVDINNIVKPSLQAKYVRGQKSVDTSSNRFIKTCPKCGKAKTTKFCQCRKNSTLIRQSLTPFSMMYKKDAQTEKQYLQKLIRQKQN